MQRPGGNLRHYYNMQEFPNDDVPLSLYHFQREIQKAIGGGWTPPPLADGGKA